MAKVSIMAFNKNAFATSFLNQLTAGIENGRRAEEFENNRGCC